MMGGMGMMGGAHHGTAAPASGQQNGASTSPATKQSTAESSSGAGAATKGDALFHGETLLANRGMACINCHRVEGKGGTSGPDLTDASTKLGRKKILNALENPNTPVMGMLFKNAPLTHKEARDILAYLESLGASNKGGGKSAAPSAP